VRIVRPAVCERRLSNSLPAGHEVGALSGQFQPGDVSAFMGAGPVGLAAMTGCRVFNPRHVVAWIRPPPGFTRHSSSALTSSIGAATDPAARVAQLTDGLDAGVAIEAVGALETFELAAALLWPGGRVANVGVHGKPAPRHLETLWIRDVTSTTGLVDTHATARLLRLLTRRQIKDKNLVSFRVVFGEIEKPTMFECSAETGALEMVVTAAPFRPNPSDPLHSVSPRTPGAHENNALIGQVSVERSQASRDN
jgi:alcohol dehydrogenase